MKVYPQGVTTGSESGVTSLDEFFPVFAAMQQHDLVLNLHGEVPSSHDSRITSMNAEEEFLPTLFDLHKRFPKLRIVLEHISDAKSIAAVRACGPSVVGKLRVTHDRGTCTERSTATITCHHLSLTFDDVIGDPFNFCKPLAKSKQDRDALLKTVCSGDPKFFL